MKHIYSLSLLLLLICTPGARLYAQWVQANGPFGGRIPAAAVDGPTVYVGTYGSGLYASSNDGALWTSVGSTEGYVNTTAHSAVVEAIDFSGSTLLMGTSAGIFRTTDKVDWSWPLTGVDVRSIRRLGNLAFAGANGQGLFRSSDDGISWALDTAGLTNSYVFSLIALGPKVFAGTGGGAFVSNDSGSSWTPVSNGLPTDGAFTCFTVSGDTLLAGNHEHGLYASPDSGASWTLIHDGSLGRPVSLLASGGSLFEGTDDDVPAVGLFRSTDGGASWADAGITNPGVFALTANGSGIYAGTSIGVFRSTDAGASWTFPNTGIALHEVNAFARIDTTLFAGTFSGVFRSLDGGEHWEITSAGLSASDETRGLVLKGSTLWAGMGGGIFKSTDKGTHWVRTTYNMTISLLVHGTTIFAGSITGELRRSTDDGATWTQLTSGLPPNPPIPVLAPLAEFGTNVFAGMSNLGVYRSSDDGDTWVPASAGLPVGLPSGAINALLVKDSSLFAGTSGSGIFRSTDQGGHWIEMNNGTVPISGQTGVNCFAVKDSLLFAGTNGGVLRSTNDGLRWNLVNPGLERGIGGVQGLIVRDTMLIAGLNGISLRPYSEFFVAFLGGQAWKDRNYDGGRGPLDSAIAGRTITLNGPAHYSSLTDTNGQYQFSDLVPGTYTVSESLPECWVQTVPPIWYNPYPTYTVEFLGGEGITNFDFGSGPSSCYQGPPGGDLFSSSNYRPGESPNDSGSVTLADSVVVSHIPGQVPGSASKTVSQFTLGALHVKNGGVVHFNPDVGTLKINTTVQFDSGSRLSFPSIGTNAMQCSGNWISHGALDAGNSQIVFSGHSKSIILDPPPAVSSGNRFYDIDLTGDSTAFAGKLRVAHTLSVDSMVIPRNGDSILVENSDEASLGGSGKIMRGSIQRAIKPGTTASYRFESPLTTIQFHGDGTNPSRVSMTAYPDTVPYSFRHFLWKVVGGTPNVSSHTITADSIGGYSKWATGVPRPHAPSGQPGVNRMYVISQDGGSNFSSQVQLRYNPSEIQSSADENSLQLMKGVIDTVTPSQGWNMVSLPFIAEVNQKSALYPGGISSAFRYNGGYQQTSTLDFKGGYWLKFPSQQAIEMLGDDRENDTLPLISGWNMIGGISVPVAAASVNTLPSGLAGSPFFGYTDHYVVADSLIPGNAYWIKVRSAGSLVLAIDQSGLLKKQPATARLGLLSQITINDASGHRAELYFGSDRNIDESAYTLPPLPPEGAFDVRYGDQQMVELSSDKELRTIPIQFMGASYPLTIRWALGTHSQPEASLLVDSSSIPMTSDGMALVQEGRTISLRLGLAPETGLPAAFSLMQNYPNPFNPVTSIRYTLPSDARVTLKIYNILGQEVAALVDDIQTPGFKAVSWNASGAASGVYYYRITATALDDSRPQTYREVRKMMVIR